MIAYMANERCMRTGYLALTRGDGGQNLIGKEVREQMGIIRTQELLAARRTDGGQQFFSRANDFGYSKHPDETLNIWDKDQVLADVVWTIRKFRPDVIITRFSPDRDGKTHGHHTTSAKLALEAFKLAGDPKAYPEQLQYVETWQPKRIAWNTSWWFFRGQKNPDYSQFLSLDVGAYNTLLGKGYGEIAAESRSQHRSQGFGAAMQYGKEIEYFAHLAGDSATHDILEDIETGWGRIAGGEAVGQPLQQAYESFDMLHPERSLPLLLQAYEALEKLPQDHHYVVVKKPELENLLLNCAGIWADANANDFSFAPGDSLKVEARFIKRLPAQATLKKVALHGFEPVQLDSVLKTNVQVTTEKAVTVPRDMAFSQPYWLRERPGLGMFKVAEQQLIGLPENPPAFRVTFEVVLEGKLIALERPVRYRWVDPAIGELHRPVSVAPPVTANLGEGVYIYADNQAQEVTVKVMAHTDTISGTLRLELPNGWQATPEQQPFELFLKGEERDFTFNVLPPKDASTGILRTLLSVEGAEYAMGYKLIDYAHIPKQILFPQAEAKVAKLDIQVVGKKVGYIMGAGDAVPEALRQIGFEVDLLSDDDVTVENLAQYDAVIAGVRAYNTNEKLKFHQPKLMEYVRKGGNYIIQYNTSFRLATDELGPFPLKLSRDRVAVEKAPVKFLDAQHPVLQFPNQITQQDFEDWVQERGLYFPNEWSEEYTPIFEMNDPGEDPKQGALLVADYGKGHFLYTGLSFFRELPAGVPGAFRLLANMIAYGKSGKASE